mmetsp:Transcript_123428/g.360432  ORF Transcript_123428/g.360432 Transcript_123428/m.360432 type:complete len:215 (-) Transcript_123428:167-811(-)
MSSLQSFPSIAMIPGALDEEVPTDASASDGHEEEEDIIDFISENSSVLSYSTWDSTDEDADMAVESGNEFEQDEPPTENTKPKRRYRNLMRYLSRSDSKMVSSFSNHDSSSEDPSTRQPSFHTRQSTQTPQPRVHDTIPRQDIRATTQHDIRTNAFDAVIPPAAEGDEAADNSGNNPRTRKRSSKMPFMAAASKIASYVRGARSTKSSHGSSST